MLHFLGFAILGLLTVWRLGERRRGLAVILLWFVGLAAYGVFDETTQPFFNRDCEFFDWIADCGGGAFGMTIGVVATRFALFGS
jgi:VanZ family protein